MSQKKLTSSSKLAFTFDECFDTFSSNHDVYKDFVLSTCESVLKGINGTVFMYG
jgi:hypothetical protein